MRMRTIALYLLLLATAPVKAQCDPFRYPVIFVHGFLASGDTWSNAFRHFRLAGYCSQQLYAFDWNTIGGNNKINEQALIELIDQVRATTGAAQVDMIGHSAGGGLARKILADSLQAQKIRRYIHTGSSKWTSEYTWFRNERCLNIFSLGDRVAVNTAGIIEGATNITLAVEDHYEVATAPSALNAMYTFLNPVDKGGTPLNPIVKNAAIAGKAVLLGDNSPMRGAIVRIYVLNKNNGKRIRSDKSIRLKVAEDGSWGPISIDTGQPIEMELTPEDSTKRKISYFFQSFDFDDPLVYLRGIPESPRMNALLGKIPQKEDQSVLVLYAAKAAMVGGRDSVTVNNIPLCSPPLTPAARTIITSFVFDDGDGVSSQQLLKQYAFTPFIGGVDVWLPAGEKQVHRLYYNGKKMNLPGAPSSERILLAVLK